MTPKEKAEDLWLTYYERLPDGVFSDYAAKTEAKQCALITVSEIVIALEFYAEPIYELQNMDRTFHYWQRVKEEIEKL